MKSITALSDGVGGRNDTNLIEVIQKLQFWEVNRRGEDKIKGAFFGEEGSFRYVPLIRYDPNGSW